MIAWDTWNRKLIVQFSENNLLNILLWCLPIFSLTEERTKKQQEDCKFLFHHHKKKLVV